MGADWLFLTYRPSEALAIRAGRQIAPVFLYSEQIDVGFTYLWARLPYEVYGFYPLKSVNGLSLLYSLFWGDLTLRTEVFGGAGDLTLPNGSFSGSANEVKGFDIALSSDHFKLRGGYSASNPTGRVFNALGNFPADLGTAQVYSVGGSFDYLGFVGAAEANRFVTSGHLIEKATGFYGSLGYRVLPALIPYVMYAQQSDVSGTGLLYPDMTVSFTPRTGQNSKAVGLNFKLSPSAVLKTEYMRTEYGFLDTSRNYGADTFTGSLGLVF
jgi:hypothetical protein